MNLSFNLDLLFIFKGHVELAQSALALTILNEDESDHGWYCK